MVCPQKSVPVSRDKGLQNSGIGQVTLNSHQPLTSVSSNIKDKLFTAILDSQASHSFINMNVAKLLQPRKLCKHEVGQHLGNGVYSLRTSSPAVSYTHLDVYKRQGVLVVSNISTSNFVQPLCCLWY